jgi:pre-mRNA-processing factor 40
MAAFCQALLQELLDQNKIKAKSMWKEVYPLFKDDSRYLNILGNPGSTPLELFWDAVDKLDQVFDVKAAKVKAALKEKDLQFGSETTVEEFTAALQQVSIPDVSNEDLHNIYQWVSYIQVNLFHSEESRPLVESRSSPR